MGVEGRYFAMVVSRGGVWLRRRRRVRAAADDDDRVAAAAVAGTKSDGGVPPKTLPGATVRCMTITKDDNENEGVAVNGGSHK